MNVRTFKMKFLHSYLLFLNALLQSMREKKTLECYDKYNKNSIFVILIKTKLK